MARSTTHTLDAVAQLAKNALRTAWASAPGKQQDRYVSQLAKDTLSRPRSRCVEQVFAIGFDLVDRNAPLEQAEEFGHFFIAAMRERHAERQGPAALSLAEAHVAEEQAQGEMENAETALIHGQTAANLARYLMARSRYWQANETLHRIVRRLQVQGAAA